MQIRSSETGEVLFMAPNFDNDRACVADPSGACSDPMLRFFMKRADSRDHQDLKVLCNAVKNIHS